MKKRFIAALLCLCMTLTLLPTTAFAALSDSLGNTPKENQSILEQLSALTGGSSDQAVLASDAPFAHSTAATTSAAARASRTTTVRTVFQVFFFMDVTPK